MSFPQKVKAVAVLTTIKPVTQTADVEVKRASRIESPFPGEVVKGIIRRIVPVRITDKKLNRIVCAGCRDIPSKKFDILLSLLKIPVQIKKLRMSIIAGGIRINLKDPLLIIKNRLIRKKRMKKRAKVRSYLYLRSTKDL